MQIRLYIDEDSMSKALARNLRMRGIDVLTVAEAENKSLTDAEQLDFAYTEQRVIYSANVGDFQQLHTAYLIAGKPHAGLILVAQQTFSIGEQSRRLLHLIHAKTAEAMQNNLEFLSKW